MQFKTLTIGESISTLETQIEMVEKQLHDMEDLLTDLNKVRDSLVEREDEGV